MTTNKSPDQPSETSRPWARNRNGDPRQLLHEAANLDIYVRQVRAHAARLRAEAAERDAAADQMAEAASDYRAWAKAREETNA